MKKVACHYHGCAGRRVHYERPDELRDRVMIEVPDDFPEAKKAYCSIECAAYDGALKEFSKEKA